MREVKTLEIPRFRKILAGDEDMLKTLDQFQQEQWYEIFLPSSRETDHRVPLPDGSITRVAASPSINGVQWIIPAGQKVQVPQSIYELVINADHQREIVVNKIACPIAGRSGCIGSVERR